ncbi:MAG TPA: hypothetical protein VF163_20770, partial [Micromonosporaceae bacterium]
VPTGPATPAVPTGPATPAVPTGPATPAQQPAWSAPEVTAPVAEWESGPAPWAPPRRRPPVLAGLVVAVVVAALGGPLGWLWSGLAPRLSVIKAEDGFFYADPEPEQAIAADGWFALLGLALGGLIAVLAWTLLRRHRGVTMILALAIGSLAAAWLAWWVGTRIGMVQFEQARDAAAFGQRVNAPLSLRVTDLSRESPWVPLTTGVAAVQALASAFVYTVLAGFSSHAELHRGEASQIPGYLAEPVDSDQFGPGRTGRSESDTGTARA